MAACNFTIPFEDNVESMIQKAQSAILKVENATFNGDTKNGLFSLPTPLGEIKGSYVIETKLAHFSIEEKPFLVSCSLIESKLTGYLNTVV
jgi:hypothetical protein